MNVYSDLQWGTWLGFSLQVIRHCGRLRPLKYIETLGWLMLKIQESCTTIPELTAEFKLKLKGFWYHASANEHITLLEYLVLNILWWEYACLHIPLIMPLPLTKMSGHFSVWVLDWCILVSYFYISPVLISHSFTCETSWGWVCFNVYVCFESISVSVHSPHLSMKITHVCAYMETYKYKSAYISIIACILHA